MGSRAVVLVCREAHGASARRFGVDAQPGGRGVAHTRTGRPLFAGPTSEALLERVAKALDGAGVWDELGADWVLLDAEILPWSAKADQLIRDQYASVGAAARAVMPAALTALDTAVARGVDVEGLRARTMSRAEDAERYTRAYRRYRWPVDGLDGVQLAPFQVLASGSGAVGAHAGGATAADREASPLSPGELAPGGSTAGATTVRTSPVAPGPGGATYATRDHLWHLGIADRLVEADPVLFRSTRRLVVDLADDASRAEGIAWWEELTGAGGEGMVVKPRANLVRGPRGIVQPGLKVRGREYLRIIYGPEYTQERHLERLRVRSLGRKQSLALREYALGLEALERVVADEPLWRVHEAVFAVLALESEPVDPRL